MNFHLKSKPKSRYGIKTILVSIFVVFLLVFTIFFPNFTTNALHTVFKPFWYAKNRSVVISDYFFGFLSLKSSIIKENAKLEEELVNLRMTKIDYETLLKENEELKLVFDIKNSSNKVVSNILSKPPQSPFDTFVLDSGADSGVSVGDRVYISDTIIVGKIAEVTPKTSIVRMFSNGGQESEVTSARTGNNFVIKGSGGSNFTLEVPKETDIVWGDVFLYPGSNTSVIASVYFVDSSSQSSFKTVHLRYPVNIFQSKRVFVLKNS